MNAFFKKSLTVAVVSGLSIFGIASAMAQSYLNAGSKMRGDYGQMSRSVTPMRPTYQATAPAQTRSFSYEPSQGAPAPAASGCGCGAVSSAPAAAPAPAPTARSDSGTLRSFSYEPSMRTNSAPMSRAQTPLYLVPKSQR